MITAKELMEALPSKVKVAGTVFKIKRVSSGEEGLDEDADGMTLFDRHMIVIDHGLTLQRTFNAVYHEIQHCVNSEFDIDDGVDEENVAKNSANGWTSVFIDNPRLVTWFRKVSTFLRKEWKSKI